MKKLMGILLGLSLVIGTGAVAFSQDKEETKKVTKATKATKAKKTKRSKATTP
jgi:hypothetical protein